MNVWRSRVGTLYISERSKELYSRGEKLQRGDVLEVREKRRTSRVKGASQCTDHREQYCRSQAEIFEDLH